MFLGRGLLKGTEGAVRDGYGTAAVFPVAADELAEIVGCNFYLGCCIQRTYLSANNTVADVCATDLFYGTDYYFRIKFEQDNIW